MHRDIIKECTWLKEQVTPQNFKHTQWTFVVKIERDDVNWIDFKKRFEGYGGDGPFGCWKITYQEDLFKNRAFERLNTSVYKHIEYKDGICPVAEVFNKTSSVFNKSRIRRGNRKTDKCTRETIKSFD